jgi:hypothetical protein
MRFSGRRFDVAAGWPSSPSTGEGKEEGMDNRTIQVILLVVAGALLILYLLRRRKRKSAGN